MRDPRLLLRLAAILFGLLGTAHVLRLLTRFPIILGTLEVPHWASGIAVVALGALAIVFWRASGRIGGP